MRELWGDLGTTMRSLRLAGGLSLRQVEAETGIGRGTLSQIENGKARANRRAVEWYDATFGGEGALVAMYSEARGAHGESAPRPGVVSPGSSDRFLVESCTLAQGEAVVAGSERTVSWRLRNVGASPWRGRALHRVGTAAVPALIRCPVTVPVPDCVPGGTVTVPAVLRFPAQRGTQAAYWQLVAPGRTAGRWVAASTLLALFVTVLADGETVADGLPDATSA